jgi:2-keto-3-deoxy-L-rhamnonate aldolase RhmA
MIAAILRRWVQVRELVVRNSNNRRSSMNLKKRFAEAAPLCGTFIFSSDPATTEIAARAGFDFVIVDREHTTLSWRDVASHVRAARAAGIATLVRIRKPDGGEVEHALDAGAEGVVVPHFGLDRAASAECVTHARYAPLGTRGTCTGTTASGYGLTNFSEIVAEANSEAMVVVQIEDASVALAAQDILAEIPVDAIMPGLADLSTSLGHPGAFAHPKVADAVDGIVRAADARNIPLGLYIPNADALTTWKGGDVRFYVYAIDYKVIAEGYRNARLAIDRQLAAVPRRATR